MADPGELVEKLVQKHFPKFGKIRKLCTYRRLGTPEYDNESGDNTETVIQEESIYIIFDEFGFTETQSQVIQKDDESILKTDRKAGFPSLDLPFVPEANDEIIRQDNGSKWNVIGFSSDPMPGYYELHVRPKK